MSLPTKINRYNIAETVMNLNILRQMEDDLDMDEKISILFLIIEDYATAFSEIFSLFQESKREKINIITDYVEKHPKNWKDKILEALCIVNNREIIKKLGLSFDELDCQYVPKIKTCSRSINVIAKCLYVLCESVDATEQKLLINWVKSEKNVNYLSLLNNVDYLELHILYWMHIGYITISKDKKHNLAKLLKYLKKSNDFKIICLVMDLEKFDNHHVVDSTYNQPLIQPAKYRLTYDEYQQISLEEKLILKRNMYKKKVRFINKGLCVIINEEKFKDKYESRYGSTKDTSFLIDTFQLFGFTIYQNKNLNREEILEVIMKLREKVSVRKYDCILLFILSHGYKGGIISSDEKEISLEEIENAFCCMELKDIIKVVFVQACQGTTRGNTNNHLTTDGLSNASSFESIDVRQYANFFMFMSTLQGYVSMRHSIDGTWFVQEVCKIFRAFGNEFTFLECIREIMLAVQRKHGTIEGNRVAQLAEIRQDRLDSDFQLQCQERPNVNV